MIKNKIEEEIDVYLKKVMTLLFKNTDVNYDVIYNNSGDEKSYFSEIEIEIWNGSSLNFVYSIIIYIRGEIQGSKEELLKDFLYDLFDEYN